MTLAWRKWSRKKNTLDGWWVGIKAVLRIAYCNQKLNQVPMGGCKFENVVVPANKSPKRFDWRQVCFSILIGSWISFVDQTRQGQDVHWGTLHAERTQAPDRWHRFDLNSGDPKLSSQITDNYVSVIRMRISLGKLGQIGVTIHFDASKQIIIFLSWKIKTKKVKFLRH